MGNKNSSKAEEDKEELERQRQIKSIAVSIISNVF
jgi:hypothetical protein